MVSDGIWMLVGLDTKGREGIADDRQSDIDRRIATRRHKAWGGTGDSQRNPMNA